MARSSYVYVVLNTLGGTRPIGGCTVKYEMVLWLKRQTGDALVGVEVYRMPDSLWNDRPVVKLNLEELLNG